MTRVGNAIVAVVVSTVVVSRLRFPSKINGSLSKRPCCRVPLVQLWMNVRGDAKTTTTTGGEKEAHHVRCVRFNASHLGWTVLGGVAVTCRHRQAEE